MKLSLFLLLISFSLSASEKLQVKIAMPEVPNGFIQQHSYEKILQCTFPKNEFDLTITKLPVLRLSNSYQNYDLYFPAFNTEKAEKLEPFYIENIIKVEAYPLTNKRVGIVFGSPEHHFLTRKGIKFDYFSKSYDGIVKGFSLARADKILIPYQYENLIERKHLITETYLVEAALGYNKNSKVKLNMEKVSNRLHACLFEIHIKVNPHHKMIILKKLTNLIEDLKLFNELSYPKVSNIANKEKTWLNSKERDPLVLETLNSLYSKNLKQFKKNYPFIQEALIMNSQGALLGTIYKTEDFDQSDEKKFKILSKLSSNFSKNNIGEIYFDISRKNFLLQIFYPLRKNGKLVGGIFLGIDPMILVNEE